MNIQQCVFGKVSFPESEDLASFRYRLLVAVLLAGAFFTALFLVGNASSLNPLHGPHLISMRVFITVSLLLWWLLRGRPQRYLPVAWLYEGFCLAEYVSALIFVPQDEMRIFWFATNIPGVYILLGKKEGAVITLGMLLALGMGNRFLPAPYSHNGLATFLVGIAYLAAFFHLFVDRALTYYARMRESIVRLEHMARHDALTGALNARAYNEQADRLIALMSRLQRPFAVLFVDLDHFKKINDTFGHLAGDTVLQAVSHCLKTSTRDSDLFGRVGGEEFSIFLADITPDAAVQFAESLRRAIERLQPILDGAPQTVTASIGIAANRGIYRAMSAIQQEADQAMYAAKAQGRNRVSLHALGAPSAARSDVDQ